MSNCKICNRARSGFLMNNKLVCMRCDELLFDLEIELEEVEVRTSETTKPAQPRAAKVLNIVKK